MPKTIFRKEKIGKLANGTDVCINVLEIGEGKPVVYLQSGVHGNEQYSIEVLRRFLSSIDKKEFKGKIIAIPIVNSLGFLMETRKWKCKDFNASFPGSDKELVERITKKVFGIACSADYAIDLHCFGGFYPFIYCTDTGNKKNLDEQLKMAKAFSPKAVVIEKVKKPAPGEKKMDYSNSFDTHVVLKNIPAITIEVGYEEFMNKSQIDRAVQGLKNIFIELGMIKGEKKKLFDTIFTKDEQVVYSDYSGTIIRKIETPHKVSKGDLIFEIFDIFDPWKPPIQIKAEKDGVVTSLKRGVTVNIGDWLYEICEKV